MVFLLFAFALLLFDPSPRPWALLGAILIHEGGHLGAAWAVGVPFGALRLTAGGFSLRFELSGLPVRKQLAVLLGGSLAGIITGLLWGRMVPSMVYFRRISLALAFLNLLPIPGLDGGGAVEAILQGWMLPHRAAMVEKGLAVGVSLLFFLAAVWISLRVQPNLSLLLAAGLFLYRSLR